MSHVAEFFKKLDFMRYDYFCPANQQTFEVKHGMSESLRTWGELCKKLEMDLGETPAESSVERVLSGGMLALPRRVSKEIRTSDFDSALHSDSCVPQPCCGAKSNCSHK